MTMPNDMITGFVHNTKNGKIEIVEYFNRNQVKIRFIPSGYETQCKSQTIREGRVKDRLSPTVLGVAMIGDGPYRNTIDYKTTPAYKCWIGMIYRCYHRKTRAYPRYGGRGVYVCDEWLNFQNFAKWHEENKPKSDGSWQLDKDIKIDGNTVYSPDTCIFATHIENTEKAKAKTFKMKSPEGDIVEFYNMAKFCREHGLSKSHLHRVYTGGRPSHKGWRAAD